MLGYLRYDDNRFLFMNLITINKFSDLSMTVTDALIFDLNLLSLDAIGSQTDLWNQCHIFLVCPNLIHC